MHPRTRARWASLALPLGFYGFLAVFGWLVLCQPIRCGGSESRRRCMQLELNIVSTALPLTVSGQEVRHVIPITGVCPGPYRMSVVQGALPPGVVLDDSTHGLRGVALEAGDFAFRIQIDALGCEPFASSNAMFQWSIDFAPAAR